MKKKISLIIICLTISGSISITENSSVLAQEDYQKVVEDYKTFFLPLDRTSYQYDCALDTVSDYLQGTVNLSEATETVNEAINSLMECKEQNLDYCYLNEEQKNLFEKYEISADEFDEFGISREYETICMISNLAELSDDLCYVEKSDSGYETLMSDQKEYKEMQELRKGYQYYRNFNYWFAGWNQEMTDYVQEQVMPELKSYISEEFTWENDKAAAESKATSYMDKYEEAAQQLSEKKEDAKKENSQSDSELQDEIFETDEFSFKVPDSWKDGYSSGSGGKLGTSYYYFVDENFSYSDGVLMHLILTYDEEFQKDEGFEYTKLDGETIFGRSIYMAVNTKYPELASRDEEKERKYLEKLAGCKEIPETLNLKTDFPNRKIENDNYSFYLPESWDGNVIIRSEKGKRYTKYLFYQKKTFFPQGNGFFLRIAVCKWGYGPDDADGEQLIAEDEDAQVMFWIAGPTGVTCTTEDKEVRAEYEKMKSDSQTIIASFQVKK